MFYMKVVVFKIAQHFAIIGNWASFVRNFVNKTFKNRPIWSHWDQPRFMFAAQKVAFY